MEGQRALSARVHDDGGCSAGASSAPFVLAPVSGTAAGSSCLPHRSGGGGESWTRVRNSTAERSTGLGCGLGYSTARPGSHEPAPVRRDGNLSRDRSSDVRPARYRSRSRGERQAAVRPRAAERRSLRLFVAKGIKVSLDMTPPARSRRIRPVDTSTPPKWCWLSVPPRVPRVFSAMLLLS